MQHALGRIAGQPTPQKLAAGLQFSGLVPDMRFGVGGGGIAGVGGERASSQPPPLLLAAELRQRHAIMAIEPPIIPVMRHERPQDLHQFLLPVGASRGRNQTELIGYQARHQGIARPDA